MKFLSYSSKSAIFSLWKKLLASVFKYNRSDITVSCTCNTVPVPAAATVVCTLEEVNTLEPAYNQDVLW